MYGGGWQFNFVTYLLCKKAEKCQCLELLHCLQFWLIKIKDAKKSLWSRIVFRDLTLGFWAAWNILVWNMELGGRNWPSSSWMSSPGIIVWASILMPAHWALADVQCTGLVWDSDWAASDLITLVVYESDKAKFDLPMLLKWVRTCGFNNPM
jgi:hypothetical protein